MKRALVPAVVKLLTAVRPTGELPLSTAHRYRVVAIEPDGGVAIELGCQGFERDRCSLHPSEFEVVEWSKSLPRKAKAQEPREKSTRRGRNGKPSETNQATLFAGTEGAEPNQEATSP